MSDTDRYSATAYHYRWIIVFGKSHVMQTSTETFRDPESARMAMEREIKTITLATPIAFAAVTAHRNFTEEECQ